MIDAEHLGHEDWQEHIEHVEGVLRLDSYVGMLVFTGLAESQDATHRFVALSILPAVLTGEFKDTPEVQRAVKIFEAEQDPVVFEAYQMMSESIMSHPNPLGVIPDPDRPRHVRHRSRIRRQDHRTATDSFAAAS